MGSDETVTPEGSRTDPPRCVLTLGPRCGRRSEFLTEPRGIGFAAALPLPALQLTPSLVGAGSGSFARPLLFPSLPGVSPVRAAALTDETPGNAGVAWGYLGGMPSFGGCPPLHPGFRLWWGGIRNKKLITFLITIIISSNTGIRFVSFLFPPSLSVRAPQLVFPELAHLNNVRSKYLQRRILCGISGDLAAVMQIGASQGFTAFFYRSPPSI